MSLTTIETTRLSSPGWALRSRVFGSTLEIWSSSIPSAYAQVLDIHQNASLTTCSTPLAIHHLDPASWPSIPTAHTPTAMLWSVIQLFTGVALRCDEGPYTHIVLSFLFFSFHAFCECFFCIFASFSLLAVHNTKHTYDAFPSKPTKKTPKPSLTYFISELAIQASWPRPTKNTTLRTNNSTTKLNYYY